MNRMPKYGSLILLGLLLLSTGGGCDFRLTMVDGYRFTYEGIQKQKRERNQFESGMKKLQVENRFGNVNVVPAGESGASWVWEAQVWADDEMAAATLLEELIIESTIEGESQTMRLVLPASKAELNGVSSDLILRVPRTVQVAIKNSHGIVEASDLSSELTIDHSHGDVVLTNLSGSCTVENSHGNLSAKQIGVANLKVSHGNTSVDSGTGNIEFVGSHGNFVADLIEGTLVVVGNHCGIEAKRITQSANIKTDHNQIRLENVAGDATIENAHGQILATGLLGGVTASNRHGRTEIHAQNGAVSVDSRHGEIRIEMAGTGFSSIDARTSHAAINLVLPSSVNALIDMTTDHGRTSSEIESDASSSQKISLRNAHGDIRIKASLPAEAEMKAEAE
jgi:hypothetical protein